MTVDSRAVIVGAGVALAIAVPFALVAGLLDSDAGALVALFVLIILAALGVGGFVAGSKGADAPLSHGALAALAAFVVGQVVSVIVKAVNGDDISVIAIAFNALLAVSMGVIGGLVAAVRNDSLRATGRPQ